MASAVMLLHEGPFYLPSSIKALLFDKDGTLILFEESWRPAVLSAVDQLCSGDAVLAQRVLEASGFDTKTQRFRGGSVLAAGTAEEVIACWSRLLPHLSIQDLKAAEAHMEAELELVVVPQMRDGLARLKSAGLILGLATNDTQHAAQAHVASLGWADLFDFVVGSDAGHGGKPEPGMLEAFCEACEVAPGQVAMVGDSYQDLEMARRGEAGLKIGVLSGTSDFADLCAHADCVLPSAACIYPKKYAGDERSPARRKV